MSGLKALHLESRPRIPTYKRYIRDWNHFHNVWKTPPVVGFVCSSCQGRGCERCGDSGMLDESQIKAEYAALKAKHKVRLRKWLDQRSMLNASMKRLSKAQKKLIDRLVTDHMAVSTKPAKAVDLY